jgi:cobalamin biosynthesis protein CobT
MENNDGKVHLWAHNRLVIGPKQRIMLIMISDDAPVDASTLSMNPGNHLRRPFTQPN